MNEWNRLDTRDGARDLVEPDLLSRMPWPVKFSRPDDFGTDEPTLRRLGSLAAALLGLFAGPSCDPGPAEVQAGLRAMCDYTPAPRWVLRDKDGARVQAMIEPRCGAGDSSAMARCLPLDFGSSSSFPCVRVIDHDGRYINLQYELATGLIEPCQGKIEDDNWSDFPAYYLNDSCGGDPYTWRYHLAFGANLFTDARELKYVESDFWYTSEAHCVDSLAAQWKWSVDSQLCTAPLDAAALCVFRSLPDWVRDLLPNPPYTMAVEYE